MLCLVNSKRNFAYQAKVWEKPIYIYIYIVVLYISRPYTYVYTYIHFSCCNQYLMKHLAMPMPYIIQEQHIKRIVGPAAVVVASEFEVWSWRRIQIPFVAGTEMSHSKVVNLLLCRLLRQSIHSSLCLLPYCPPSLSLLCRMHKLA